MIVLSLVTFRPGSPFYDEDVCNICSNRLLVISHLFMPVNPIIQLFYAQLVVNLECSLVNCADLRLGRVV